MKGGYLKILFKRFVLGFALFLSSVAQIWQYKTEGSVSLGTMGKAYFPNAEIYYYAALAIGSLGIFFMISSLSRK